MKVFALAADNRAIVSESGVHRIDEDLAENWLEAFIADGLDQVEAFLR